MALLFKGIQQAINQFGIKGFYEFLPDELSQ